MRSLLSLLAWGVRRPLPKEITFCLVLGLNPQPLLLSNVSHRGGVVHADVTNSGPSSERCRFFAAYVRIIRRGAVT